jgi:hypothetical protein
MGLSCSRHSISAYRLHFIKTAIGVVFSAMGSVIDKSVHLPIAKEVHEPRWGVLYMRLF